MLYIVSTPIWNLSDITYRAVETLKSVDLIACEDTRTSSILLRHYKIEKPLLSFHSHSGKTKTEKIISYLENWKKVALISDAGTPWFSDPGYVLIKEALEKWFEVSPIPWVSAFSTALVWSWLQMNHFLYLGFLPLKKGRQTLFEKLVAVKSDKKFQQTIVLYESVHRIIKTLRDLEKYFWEEVYVVVARELTKKFEQFKRWEVREVIKYFEENPWKVKWEFVIMF